MSSNQSSRRAVWAAGLVVATGAGIATAHGLFQVAAGAGVPTAIAWLYPLITDGLALVAYAATSRVSDGGRRYAAAIVILAAGLSGLAQATYLTGTLAGSGPTASVPTVLRFGVGAWPAIAAALTAHLLHLISANPGEPVVFNAAINNASNAAAQPYNPPDVQPYNQPSNESDVQPQRSTPDPGQPARTTQPQVRTPRTAGTERREASTSSTSARDRAAAAAHEHQTRHGSLPTVSELMTLAGVARGTAGAVLKELRAARPALHVVPANQQPRTTP